MVQIIMKRKTKFLYKECKTCEFVPYYESFDCDVEMTEEDKEEFDKCPCFMEAEE